MPPQLKANKQGVLLNKMCYCSRLYVKLKFWSFNEMFNLYDLVNLKFEKKKSINIVYALIKLHTKSFLFGCDYETL